jgi:hypothetical protein
MLVALRVDEAGQLTAVHHEQQPTEGGDARYRLAG